MVRLNEFSSNEDAKLDYNLMDDIYFYIMNDDDFYRHNYFPAMNKAKQTGDNEGMMPVIEMGIKEYCGKYNIPKQFAEAITDEDRRNLMQRMGDAETNEG